MRLHVYKMKFGVGLFSVDFVLGPMTVFRTPVEVELDKFILRLQVGALERIAYKQALLFTDKVYLYRTCVALDGDVVTASDSAWPVGEVDFNWLQRQVGLG